MRLYADVEFREQIDREKHYISPGGYEIKTRNGNAIWFDFFRSEVLIDHENRKIAHCYQSELDTETEQDAVDLVSILKNGGIESIKEWYIYTGEQGDEILHPIRLHSATFEFTDGTSISLTDELLKQVDAIFKEDLG
ncbi:MAG: hypothetical protein Q4B26_00960 [Eubacteriales bacterium]|nr:hypothetical protein [Eubacteriales bacterium]